MAFLHRDRVRTSRPSTRDRCNTSRDRSGSFIRERSLSRDRSWSSDRLSARERSLSRDRPSSRERPSSANNSRFSNRSSSSYSNRNNYKPRSRTPSPAGQLLRVIDVGSVSCLLILNVTRYLVHRDGEKIT